ncbi:SDR family NAD(P)-dependent oxidoreductase [Saccharopolyspora sp. ASAGF58]|uniref:SDR family NAD(P)-dependent oxidoreductase n=1 Tax=Saccharopolyspora sp. ASAGF58 TaxID=2719023 RepID=UPI00143FECB5|nr:glucose 1-dehydrogenase [Saccharopolyspora sp. ASAGF58]QIZ35971.1 glucose 1-dehydrogenase [Saccharopolyspora sp. ASAGF58]
MTETPLTGKVALITGAGSGIGAATATFFANMGARLALADINDEAGRAVADRLQRDGAKTLFIQADVSRADDVSAMVAAAVSHFGALDCAFNNAGIDGDYAPTHQCTEENFDRVLAVNLKGVWLCLKYELAHMLDQGHGAIVNVASVAGLVGVNVGLPAYTASKHGVVGLTRDAALEVATTGIRVNAICPGVTRTEMYDQAIKKGWVVEEQLLDHQPVKRAAQPEEIAQAAAWLCSDQSSFVTGAILPVDGAWTAC